MNDITEILTSILVLCLSLLAFYLKNLTQQYVKNEALKELLTRLNDAAFVSVQSVAQEYSDDIKKFSKNGLTDVEKQIAKGKALQKLKNSLGTKGMELVRENLSDKLDEVLSDRLEAVISQKKKL